MTDIATLRIEVKADGTYKVTNDLKQVEKAAEGAGRQAEKTGSSFAGMGKTMSKLAAGLGITIGFSAITASLVQVTGAAAKFEKSMAEVGTLTNSMDMGKLTQQVKELTAEFGGDLNVQARALYQIISAGASDAASATNILTAANKLAIGGVTDVATAADGLTSAMNAYGLTADKAADVSDMMFVAMKAGKTTIGELSANVGHLAPIAAQAGMSMEQLFAATATITKSGVETSMAMNSLRQTLANILKPSEDATKMAAQLGIQFDAAGLKSMGFSKMLELVKEKTQGNTEQLARLFPSVESLGSVMALVGETGAKDFAANLDAMAVRAGATQEAFDKMSQTTAFLGSVLKAKLANVVIEVGTSMLEYLNPALIYITANFDDLMRTAEIVGNVLLTGALTKGLFMLPGLFMAVTQSIGGTIAAMIKLTAVMLANPFGLLVVAIAAVGAALYVFKDEMLEISGVTASVAEWTSAAWSLAADSIQASFDVLGVSLKGVWNSFSSETQLVLIDIKNRFAAAFGELPLIVYDVVNSIIAKFDFMGKSIGLIMAAMLTPGDQDITGEMKQLWKEVSGTDYIGEFKKNISTAVKETQRLAAEEAKAAEAAKKLAGEQKGTSAQIVATGKAATGAESPVEKLGKTEKELAKEAKDAAKEQLALNKAIREQEEAVAETEKKVKDYIEELEFEVSLLGKTAREQALLRKEREWADEAATGELQTIIALNAQLYDNATATAAATKEQGPFAKALEGTVERIDTAFAQAWQGSFDSFSQFADSMKDAFKNLLGELAHIAITRPIVVAISTALTGGATSALAGPAGATADLASSMTNMVAGFKTAYDSVAGMFTTGGFSSTISGGLQKLAGTFESAGWDAGARFATGYEDALANSGFGSVGMGALYTAGAGIAGGYVGDKVFGGEQTGVGAAAGTVAGTYIGNVILPGTGGIIGAAVGSFVGTGLERLAGNIFGFGGKGGNNAAASTFDLGARTADTAGIGNNFSERNLAGVTALAEKLQLIADALGGSDFSGKLKIGNTSGITLDGKKFKDETAFLQYAIDEITKSATNLSAGLKDLIVNFEGTVEEVLTFAAGMVTLTEMIKTNPVDAAVKDFATALEESSTTLSDSYSKQTSAAAGLILAYDGSASATAELATAMDGARVLAYEMALSIKAVSLSIKEMLGASAASIREQMRTPEETRTFNITQRQIAMDSLATATTAEDVAKYSAMFEKYNTALFNSLDETQRRAMTMVNGVEVTVGEAYALLVDNMEALAQDRLQKALAAVRETQEALNVGVSEMLNKAAQSNQAAANTNLQSANTFGNWVQRLVTQGITVRVDTTTPAVNV
jgi:TP901 family phage tail tape measure protein